MNLEEICNNVIKITTKVGEFISSHRNILAADEIVSKGNNDFVTAIDKESEKLLVAGLQPLIPQAGFITEEETVTTRGNVYNWIIDPIDGTTNFIHGVPPHSISIALIENEEIILGVVYEIVLKECFYSYKGAPAYLNGKEINVSRTKKVADSLIGTGFPYNDFSLFDEYNTAMKYFMKHSHGIRRLGSAATDLAYVACGRYDTFFEYALKPWDIAAGIFLIQQAGGTYSDFSGGKNVLFARELIASNASVHAEMLDILSPIFKA